MKQILLSVSLLFAMSVNAQDCSDLFISEYIEGPGNNNAIEIYNPTNATIDLSAYTINRYSGSGGGINPEIWQLSGLIASGDVFVVGNGQVDSIEVGSGTSSYWSPAVDPVFYSLLDSHCNGDYDANSTFYFNGDDAMTLEKGGSIIDILGKVGEDPGDAWTDDATSGYTDANGGAFWTKRLTLVRKSSVKIGVSANPILFNPTLEYDSLPDATYTGMGSHTCDCITSIASWDCDGQGNCSDPGTGLGTYASQTACQTNCVVVTPTWDCDGQGNCSDPGTGDGTYASLPACQGNCVATAINEEISDLFIYPNPANIGETIIINTNIKIDSIDVVNIFGEKVLTQISNKIITTNFARGIYIINIRFTDGRIVDNKLIIE